MGRRIKYTEEFLRDYILKAASETKGEYLSSREVDPNIVRVIARRYGWSNFLTSIGVRPFKSERETLTDEVVRLYQEGLTMKKIGQKFGYTKGAIQDWLEKAGLAFSRTAKDYDLVNWEREPSKYIQYGYVMIRFPGEKRAIPEHRYVMEQKLGRKLEKSEIVHHLNAIKTDNRPENLAIVTRPTHPLDSKDTYRGILQARIRELEEQLENCTCQK